MGFRSFVNWLDPKLLFSETGKLAFLWFDELIVESPWIDFRERIINNAIKEKHISQDVGFELLKVVSPIQKYFPEYDSSCQFYRPKSISEMNIYDVILDQAIYDLLEQEYEEKYGESHWDSVQAVGDLRPFLTFNALRYWRKLSEKVNCCFIPLPFEHEVLRYISHTDEILSQFCTFEEVMKFRVPSISQMSLERIWELRQHEFFISFRQKVSEINSMMKAGDQRSAQEILTELENKDSKEMLRLFRPNVRTTMIKAIITNLPIPYVNPFSFYQAIKDVVREQSVSTKYGWLYFLFDAESIQ